MRLSKDEKEGLDRAVLDFRDGAAKTGPEAKENVSRAAKATL
jgi:hypothetical protein